MNNLILGVVFFIGFSGIVAQVIVMRELLISFYGNELILGIIISNWIIAEAAGVLIVGKLIEKIRRKLELFVILEIIFLAGLPFSIYLARVSKAILGVPCGETIGLSAIFLISFLINLGIGFAHGGLFSASCKIYSLTHRDTSSGIARVYALETMGTILGGIILTYFFIPHFNSFRIAFIVALANIIFCYFIARLISSKKIRYLFMFVLVLLTLFSLFVNPDGLHKLSIIKQWRPAKVLDYRNSVYGNIVVTKKAEQYTFFYNGVPAITTPYPDITFVEELGHLPLLFHPHPSDILVISSGSAGLINEALKHPLKRVDYAEVDPLIIEMLKKYPSDVVKSELSDRRLMVESLDGRFFLKTTNKSYDIILIGMLRPSDLTSNRLFTQEFFSLAKKHLRQKGIIAFTLPSSLTYLSRELIGLNRCILNALGKVYRYIRVIPGDYNLILASDDAQILGVDSGLVSRRISSQNIKTNILVPAYLDYRLDKERVRWFENTSQRATLKINRDLQPFAVFEMLVFWNKEFSGRFGDFFQALGSLGLGQISFAILLLTVLILFFIGKPKVNNSGIIYSIFTTGFFGMLGNLILIFCFQVFYGYLYYRIGLLISIFMAGLASGSILMTHVVSTFKNHSKIFIACESLIILFSLIAGILLTNFNITPIYFALLLFAAGFLTGCEFPLAGKIYLKARDKAGAVSGVLYFADLLGGYLAAILGGIFFLPVLGLFNTFIVIVLFKISSLAVLIVGGSLKFNIKSEIL